MKKATGMTKRQIPVSTGMPYSTGHPVCEWDSMINAVMIMMTCTGECLMMVIDGMHAVFLARSKAKVLVFKEKISL